MVGIVQLFEKSMLNYKIPRAEPAAGHLKLGFALID
jgi:hypothetical protein